MEHIFASLIVFCGAATAQTDDDTRLQKRVKILRRQVERMVGVKLKATVPASYVTRKDYEKLLVEPVDKDAKSKPRAESGGALAYRLLGLLPKKTNLQRSTVTMRRMQTGAFYDPGTKAIRVLEGKISAAALDALLFHELVHSTGHSTRLDRFKDALPARFGSQSYSKEELVAEMGAAFLCGSSGIVDRVIDNSAAYIASWTRRLKKDPKLVVMAAAQAQKAADYIQDVQFD